MTSLPTRRSELIVEAVLSDVILFDPADDQTHLLTGDNARVWELCDGSVRSVEQAAKDLDLTSDAVAAALARLDEAGLLQAGWSRRAMLQRTALIGAGVAVLSLQAPMTAAMASTFTGGGGGVGSGFSTSRSTVYATNFSNLLTINTTTGAVTDIGGHGGPFMIDLAVTPTGLYGTDGGNFYSVSTATGAATALPTPSPSRGYSYRLAGDVNGLLYATDGGTELFTYNPSTGVTASVRTLPLANSIADAVIAPDGTLYLSSDADLYRLAEPYASGALTLVGSMGQDADGLAFAGSSLYALSYSNGAFYSVNTATGATTLIASTGSFPGLG